MAGKVGDVGAVHADKAAVEVLEEVGVVGGYARGCAVPDRVYGRFESEGGRVLEEAAVVEGGGAEFAPEGSGQHLSNMTLMEEVPDPSEPVIP